MVLKLYVGTKFRENGQKLRKLQNLIPAKSNTFKVMQQINFVTKVSNITFFKFKKVITKTLQKNPNKISL